MTQEEVEKARYQEIKMNSSDEENPSISNDGYVKYRCPKCPLLLPDEAILNLHIKNSHT
jgi:hypothetical protein